MTLTHPIALIGTSMVFVVFQACATSEDVLPPPQNSAAGQAGGSETGGAEGFGGYPTTGGVSTSLGTGGMQTATGGAPEAGGTSGTGGDEPTGGTSMSTGGRSATGGVGVTTGGAMATGGAAGTTGGTKGAGGAVTSTGSTKLTGGAATTTTGGSKAAGGALSSGGTPGESGGAPATGGAVQSGGAAAETGGAAATGGAGTGGAQSTGPCDFASLACGQDPCTGLSAAWKGEYCQALFTCLQSNQSCITAADPLCGPKDVPHTPPVCGDAYYNIQGDSEVRSALTQFLKCACGL